MELTVSQQSERLAAKRKELFDLFENNKNANGGELRLTEDQLAEIKQRDSELNDLTVEFEKAKGADELYQKIRADIAGDSRVANSPIVPVHTSEPRRVKTLGEMIVHSPEYQVALKRGISRDTSFTVSLGDFEFKTTMTTAAGWAPESMRTPGLLVPYATRRPTLSDYIPSGTTNQTAVKYMTETTFTNNTAAAAENAVLGENALAFTEASALVENIGGFIPVTDQQLEDVPGILSLINGRLELMYYLEEEDMLLGGTGTTPQIRGFYNATNLQTQAKGADDTAVATYKAMTKVRVTRYAEPDLCVFHPNDWQDVRLSKDANGNYIWGSPAEPGVDRIWGKPVLQTTGATENTALVGDFGMFAHISRKKGATVEIGRTGDDFKYNRQSIKINGRMSLEIYSGYAFCTVTGL